MRKSVQISAVLALVALAQAPIVFADTPHGKIYSGVALTGNHLHGSAADHGLAGFDDDGYGLKVFGGYRLNHLFSVEAAIAQGHGMKGDAGAGNESIRSRDASIALVGNFDLDPKWGVFGKVGMAHTRLDSGFGDGRNNGILLGLGSTYKIDKNWTARAELERFNDYGNSGETLDRASLGVSYAY